MSLFIQLITLFIISLILAPIVLRGVTFLLTRFWLLDRPHLYKSEKWRAPAPYGAGISILVMLLILTPLIFLFGDFSPLLEKRLLIVLIIGIGISLVSFIDDMDTIGRSPVRVPPIVRLLMQIGVGTVIGLTSIKIAYMSGIFGDIIDLWSYFTVIWDYSIYYIPLIVTIFWYVLVFNSVNFSDWVPGLTGWFALISFIILWILAIKLILIDETFASQENSRFLLCLLAIIIPITFFLTRADISRKVIMGDSGTIMLAFLIATLAIIGWGKIATALSVLGIYVIDFVYVITTRLMSGQNPMKWDQSTHLHFRLMELGLSGREIRIIVYVLTAIFGLSAIVLSGTGKIILLICIAVITVFLTEILTHVKKK
jgi:UDP-GlcNAc:undecaprenyl-phosphate GlcNAc-1-phosphate transferase